ncbi:MAG TPA: alpha/beta hydrolase [Frankiaceae bacterium]|nr:alpha/beta hydrolase [Frankiaceae bacterium]
MTELVGAREVVGSGGTDVRQVAVPGRRLAVRRAEPTGADAGRPGPGNPPVLLLHGVPQTSRCWLPLLEELGRDRIVLAPDLPGLGDSEIRGPYDVHSVAASLVALLAAELDGVEPSEPSESAESESSESAESEAVEPNEPDASEVDESEADGRDGGGGRDGVQRVDLVGHDWGGSLALAVAAARPDLVRRVVVISAPYRTVDVKRAWHIPLLGFVPPAVFTSAGAAMVRAMFRYAWKSGRPPQAMVDGYAEAYRAPERVRAMAGYYRAAVRRRRSPDGTKDPSVRAERSLVVWGTDDPPMPLRVGESVVTDLGRVNDPATVRMVTLPGVGHWPLEEVPEIVLPLIADFLRGP